MPFPVSSSPLLGPLTAAPEDALLIVDGTGEHRAAELGRDLRCAAGTLCGTNRSLAGRRVGLLVEPGADWLKCLLAVLAAGGTALPLALSYPDAELGWLLSDAEADTLVASPSQSDRAVPATVRTVTPAELFAAGDSTGWEPPPGELGGEPAMLLYTSGTTGRPKGAVLTHANLAVQTDALRRAWQLTPADALLHALPLHHAHGVNISLLPALVAGATTHMMDRFDAHAVWNRLDRATVFMGVPTMYVRLLAALEGAASEERQRWSRAARGLRLAVSGSAALPARVARQWSQLAGAIPLERFGMTEVGVGMSNPLDEQERRVGRVGRPLDVIALRLVDDAGAVVARGPGEVQLRGKGVFERYWRRPQASREAFVDGWFKTGDLAERDEAGVLRILGRTSVDIIKSGGYKLSALEIEEALREHPAVADLAVVGLPDEIWGQRVAAAVIPRPGRADQCVTAVLRPWAKQQLAPYKVPREFVVLDALPRNPLGKVLKPQLAELLASRRG